MKNYIELAHRTSAPVEPVIDRIAGTPQSLTALFYVLHGLAVYADKLDKWKAWAYYGKGILPMPPVTAELRAEIPVMALETALSHIDSPEFLEILHAVVGIGSESGEMISAMMKHAFDGTPLDVPNIIEESGDLNWYLAKLFKFLNTTFEDVQSRNINKLKARYPGKFTEDAAKNRDLDAERAALTKGEREFDKE